MKNRNVVVKQSCHSRVSLLGIFRVLSRYLKRIIPELVSGSSTHVVTKQQALKTLKKFQGLSNFITAHGFTLIELLVVVLIIGILAAVAVPQYTKAVEKSRLTEVKTNINALRNAIEVYTLSNGFPATDTDVLNAGLLDIDFSHLSAQAQSFIGIGSRNALCSTHFCYVAKCSPTDCFVAAKPKDKDDYSFALWFSNNRTWTKAFYPCSDLGQKIYKSLETEGYEEYFC